MYARLFRIIVLIFAAISCKDKGNTSLKTLDNIASSKPIYDACEGNLTAHALGIVQLKNLPHLQKALRAVPAKIQQGFFEDLKGSIEVVSSFSKADCPDMLSLNPQRADDLLGCWQRLPNQHNSIKIVLRKQPSEPNKEQYALVRIFGFIYGDILVNRVIPNNSSEVRFAEFSPNFTFYRRSLASTFLGELAGIVTPQDRPNTIQMLSQLGISATIFNTSSDSERQSLMLTMNPSALDAFSSRVFGESFHSRFCTVDTFKRACKMFRETMAQFKPYADDAGAGLNDKCPDVPGDLSSKRNASSTHVEYFALTQGQLSARRQANLDNGAYSNAQIAQSGTSGGQLALGGLDMSSIMGLISGGASGLASKNGIMGFLQMLFWTGQPVNPGIYPTPIPGYIPVPTINPGNIPVPTINPGNTPIPTFNPIPSTGPANTGDATADEMAAFNATNAYRATKSLPALQYDNTLLQECRQQAQQQVQNGLTHWILGQGTSTAENIAYGQPDGASVAQTWIDSPGHNANIVATHSFMAVGSYSSGGTLQWCQRFR